jgi:hypothetical protein
MIVKARRVAPEVTDDGTRNTRKRVVNDERRLIRTIPTVRAIGIGGRSTRRARRKEQTTRKVTTAMASIIGSALFSQIRKTNREHLMLPLV